jgi:hypothetical protein
MARGLTSPFAMSSFPSSTLPTSVAGRLALVEDLLAGVPIVVECSCGCGETFDTGRREPLITKEDARRLIEAIE